LERFTQRAIDAVVNTVGKKRGVVFLAWGLHAQKRVARVDGKNLVLKGVHPSPLSAYKGDGFVSSVMCSHVTILPDTVQLRTLQKGE
jgi:uracil DNA glycosylase